MTTDAETTNRDPVTLNMLPASLFPTPESIRAFVASESFNELTYLVECMVEGAGEDDKHATEEERGVGWNLVKDLQALAQAAARGASVKAESKAYRVGLGLERVATLAGFTIRQDCGEGAARVLLKIIVDHVAAAPKAETVERGAQ